MSLIPKSLATRFALSSIVFFAAPLFAAAADAGYVPLAEIPGLTTGIDTTNLATFFNSLYAFCIGIAVVLAVIQIIRGGITYMVTDIIPEKGKAKDLIFQAIVGLILVLSPRLILGIINPNIYSLQIDSRPLRVTGSGDSLTFGAGGNGGSGGGTEGSGGGGGGSSTSGGVVDTDIAPPTCSFDYQEPDVPTNPYNLVWTTTGANSVSIDHLNPGLGSSLPANGQQKTVPTPSADTTYTLTATGDGGTATCSQKISLTAVTGPPPKCTLTASPNPTLAENGTVLSWTFKNAANVVIGPFPAITKTGTDIATGGSGSAFLLPQTKPGTVYTLVASNASRQATCSQTVRINETPLQKTTFTSKLANGTAENSIAISQGDTLASVARTYGGDAAYIAKYNGLTAPLSLQLTTVLGGSGTNEINVPTRLSWGSECGIRGGIFRVQGLQGICGHYSMTGTAIAKYPVEELGLDVLTQHNLLPITTDGKQFVANCKKQGGVAYVPTQTSSDTTNIEIVTHTQPTPPPPPAPPPPPISSCADFDLSTLPSGQTDPSKVLCYTAQFACMDQLPASNYAPLSSQ